MYRRYAVYQAPLPGSRLARLGAAWLGRDARTGAEVAQPDAVRGLWALTAAPRRYGLHATLKPPMRLAEGRCEDAFMAAVEDLAARCAPVDLGRMKLILLRQDSGDGFLALVPEDPPPALAALAAEVVRALDDFRAPADAAELARRRAAGLNPRQEALLERWGYPHVMEAFRFHITLSGPLDSASTPDVVAAAEAHFAPVLSEPQRIADLAVFGEGEDGAFHDLRRFVLTG